MTDASTVLSALRDGASLGVQFSPLFGALAAALAAALWGYPRAPRDRRWWAAMALFVGWLAGDGLRVLGRARDYYDRMAGFTETGLPAWPGWVTIGTWAAVSLLVGYVLPSMVGAAVGRRVTHGTGWLAAAGIAATLSLVIAGAVGALS